MKTCADCRAELVDLVFGELDDVVEIDLNEHLLACVVCREEERRLLALQAAARAGEQSPSPELRSRIRAALPRDRARGGIGLLRRPVPVYVALAAGLMGALLVAAMPARNRPYAERGSVESGSPRQPPMVLPGRAQPFTVAASCETGVLSAPSFASFQSRTLPEDSL